MARRTGITQDELSTIYRWAKLDYIKSSYCLTYPSARSDSTLLDPTGQSNRIGLDRRSHHAERVGRCDNSDESIRLKRQTKSASSCQSQSSEHVQNFYIYD